MTNRVLYSVVAACVIFSLWFFAEGVGNLTLDLFAFRQSQTAISAYWIAQGGPLLGYETPVLGAPWAIPFEFPLYQYVVALLSKTGVTINVAGRFVSFALFLLTIWPVSVIFRRLGYQNSATLVFVAIFITSPMYVFWSRSVMIETTAVFLSTTWLALLISYQQERTIFLLVSCVISGTLAMLTKITTFPPFALLGAAIYSGALYADWRDRRAVSLPLMMATAATVLIPIVVSLYWLSYSDGIKSLNAVGAQLTSSALKQWNFGTIEQKFGAELWYSILRDRILPEITGYSNLLCIAVIGAGLALGARSLHIILCIIAFACAFMLFTILHIVHNYYQTANAIFLIAALAISVDGILVKFKPILSIIILLCILAGQVVYVNSIYLPMVQNDTVTSRIYTASIAAKNATTTDQSILVFGTDWSSVVPYYAERRGFAVPNWAAEDLLADILADPQRFLGEHPLGAIVDCFADKDTRPSATLVKNWLTSKETIFEGSGCRVLRP